MNNHEKGKNIHPAYRLLLATGFLGSYTTFSSFTYETLALFDRGDYMEAALNVAGSILVGLLATLGGMAAARLLA